MLYDKQQGMRDDLQKLKVIMDVTAQCKLVGRVDDYVVERLAISVLELKHLPRDALKRISTLLLQQDFDNAIREMRKLLLASSSL